MITSGVSTIERRHLASLLAHSDWFRIILRKRLYRFLSCFSIVRLKRLDLKKYPQNINEIKNNLEKIKS